MSYPWVNFKVTRTAQVSSTPTLIWGSELGCSIESIVVVNTTANDLLLDITILSEVDLEPITYYLIKQLPITAFGKQEIINTNFQNNVGISETDTASYTLSGDTMSANSNFVGSLFDCQVSYRELTDTIALTGESLAKFREKIEKSKHPQLISEMRRKYDGK